MSDRTALASAQPSILAELARDSFLDRYTAGTRQLYALDLRIWFEWCAALPIDPLDAKRVHLEAFGRWLMSEKNNGARATARRMGTIRSWFRLAAADEIIDRDPTTMAMLPKWRRTVPDIEFLTPAHTAMLLAAAKDISPAHHALVGLMLYLGLRVSEACRARIEDLIPDKRSGYTMLHGTWKGGKVFTAPIPMPLMQILSAAAGDREEGPIVQTITGRQQSRNGAYAWVRIVAKHAGLDHMRVTPHSFRHAAAKMLADAGVPLEEIQEFLGHSDIRTTMIYVKRKVSPERYAGHMVGRALAPHMLVA